MDSPRQGRRHEGFQRGQDGPIENADFLWTKHGETLIPSGNGSAMARRVSAGKPYTASPRSILLLSLPGRRDARRFSTGSGLLLPYAESPFYSSIFVKRS